MPNKLASKLIAAAAHRSHAGHILNEIEAATDFEVLLSCEPHFRRVCEGTDRPGEARAATMNIDLEAVIPSVDGNVPAMVAQQLREWSARLEQMAQAVESVPPEVGFCPKCYLVRDVESGETVSQHYFREPAIDDVTARRELSGKPFFIDTASLTEFPETEQEMLRMINGVEYVAMTGAAGNN